MTARASDTRFPLSASQTLFWNGQKMAPDAPLYNMAWRFDLYLDLDRAAFLRAFGDVVGTIDAMRAVFGDADGVPFQRLSPAAALQPEFWDISDTGDTQATITDWMPGWIAAPFDLGACSYRARLIKCRADHWVFCIVQHHIACDAQSGTVLMQALSDRYVALCSGETGAVPPTPSYFEAVSGWVAAQKPHSAQSVTTAEPAPHARPYGAVPSMDPASTRIPVPVDAALQTAIDGFATDPAYRLFTPDLSRFATYLTAYAAFLHRVTGDERISLGVPSHNRLSDKDRATQGLFVEMLPFEVTVTPGERYDTLYAKVKQGIGTFLRTARPNAVLSAKANGVSAVLNFIQARFDTFAGAPMRVEYCHSGAHDAAHAIRLQITDFDGSGQSTFALDINDTVLQAAQPSDIVAHFERTLHACVTRPTETICETALVSAAQQSAIAALGAGAHDPHARRLSVPDMIAQQVQTRPEQTALRCGDQQISYAQMQTRVTAMAAHLTAQGIGPGDRVAVHMNRGVDLVISVLGILRAGACFVPISAETPDARALQIMALSRASAVVVDAACAPAHANTETRLIAPDAANGPDTAQHAALPDVDPGAAAYVLFTSGSSGAPKGVVVDHAGLARYIRWAASAFGGRGAADYALFSSISFDLTITSLFAPLTSGGTMVIYPETTGTDLAVLDVFAEDAVDVVKLTPSHLSLALEAGRPVSRIRTLVLGGENLTSALCREAQNVLSDSIEIMNEYGPTEAVVGAMEHRFDADRDIHPSVPIGRPADGVQITVRDAALNLSPVGIVGEICIAGRLSKGYFGRDDLTAQSFVPDPLNPGHLIYRTGDLGRLRADGSFDYLGRSDRQLKINGVRIEPAEIEQAILATPGVQAAYVRTDFSDVGAVTPAVHCVTCGMPDTSPDVSFDADGVCTVCTSFEQIRARADAYFETPDVLRRKITEAAQNRTGRYDAVMLLSGGKDSTYAAYRLSEITDRVLALTLDNGFLSEEAMANVRRVTNHLGWDHQFMTTDAMNAIFVDSIKTFSNVCQGCFKTLYTLALRVARDKGVPAIVTGLSRGQFFETRLTPDLFEATAPTTRELEDMTLQARKSYHAKDDAVARLLETRDIIEDGVLDTVEIIDLYRYIDVPVSEIYRYLEENAPWVRPGDTGRSTNCRINDLGIFMHKKREGFHNYALPYSWDVRMGHKTRDQALAELDDTIDAPAMHQMLEEIGFDEPVEPTVDSLGIVAYAAATTQVSEKHIRETLTTLLPRGVRPAHLVLLDRLPLTANGKIDTARLPMPQKTGHLLEETSLPPRTPAERRIAEIFEDVLGLSGIGVQDDFFDLGGDSLAAIRIAMQANEAGIDLPATALFSHPTVAQLSAAFAMDQTDTPDQDDDADDADDLLDLDEGDLSAISRALS